MKTVYDCAVCPLKDTKQIFSVLPVEMEVLVVGQSVTDMDIKLGAPFSNNGGRFIKSIINTKTDKIGFINCINCREVDVKTGEDVSPSTTTLKCCRSRLYADIKEALETRKPRVVLLFGAVAKKAYKDFLKNNPEFVSVLNYGFDSPTYILANRHLQPRYSKSVLNVLTSVFDFNVVDAIVASSFVTYDESMYDEFVEDFLLSGKVGADIETNSKEYLHTDKFKIGTISISCTKKSWFFDHREKDDIRNSKAVKFALECVAVQKIFANCLYDVVGLEYYGFDVNNYSDLFPLAFMTDNTFMNYGLDDLVLRYMPEWGSYKSKFKSDVIDNDFLNVDTHNLFVYNTSDSYCTRKIYMDMCGSLPDKQKAVFDAISIPMFPILVNTVKTGMKVDVQILEVYKTAFKARLVEINEYFATKHGITNINSTPQIKNWLFKTNKLKPVKYTGNRENKNPSTDKDVLRTYSVQLPDVDVLYEGRRVANVLSYFLKSIEDNVGPNGIIHPNYKHFGVASYRLSCSAPNLQGIPRDETKVEFLDKWPLRRLFTVRDPDDYMIEFDFSQQEIRLIAELSKDKNLIDAFMRGDDIHKYVASLLFHKAIKDVTKQERQIAKGCVFGSIFGSSAKEMGIKLQIPEHEAQSHLDFFFKLFPGLKSHSERCGSIVLRDKVIFTILGRPRRFIIHQRNINEVKREAANHVVQGLAADVTYMSMIRIFERLKEDGVLNKFVKVCHTVHDSILFEVKPTHLQYVVDVVPGIMENVPKSIGFKIPFPVDYKVGRKWGSEEDMKNILR